MKETTNRSGRVESGPDLDQMVLDLVHEKLLLGRRYKDTMTCMARVEKYQKLWVMTQARSKDGQVGWSDVEDALKIEAETNLELRQTAVICESKKWLWTMCGWITSQKELKKVQDVYQAAFRLKINCFNAEKFLVDLQEATAWAIGRQDARARMGEASVEMLKTGVELCAKALDEQTNTGGAHTGKTDWLILPRPVKLEADDLCSVLVAPGWAGSIKHWNISRVGSNTARLIYQGRERGRLDGCISREELAHSLMLYAGEDLQNADGTSSPWPKTLQQNLEEAWELVSLSTR